jgi:DNA-binding XRE family transcriptional regulator
MSVQFIETDDGKRLAVLPEADYRALIEAKEENDDLAAVREFDARLARGEEELISAEYVNRMIDGENKIRVWREYRGLTVKALAEAAGVTPAYLSQIETGAREGTIETLKKLSAALRVTIDDIA